MSKRVLIILAIGLLCIIAAFFVHKMEVSDLYESDLNNEDIEPDPDSEPKPKKNKKFDDLSINKTLTDEPIQEQTEAASGTDKK